MTDWTLLFDPLVPLWLIITFGVIGVLLTGFALWRGRPGALLRAPPWPSSF
jgi:uncharacterized iron-regulated membrane protein